MNESSDSIRQYSTGRVGEGVEVACVNVQGRPFKGKSATVQGRSSRSF
ncbi:hypothetical protein [Streptomyces sp. NPDC047525]